MNKALSSCMTLLLILLLGACASKQVVTGEEGVEQQLGLNPADPWENYNRKIFTFNTWLDTYIARPVAVGYDTVTPDIVQSGVRNFFSNLGEVYSFVNNILQLDIEGAGTSFMRFTVNTTFGLFGLLDVATEVGMQKDQEDLGQTLGRWGVGSGNYLMLPIVGPSSTRDVFSYADTLYYDEYGAVVDSNEQRYTAIALKFIQLRTDLLSLEDALVGDKYTALRDAYLQRRAYLVNDGEIIEDTFFDDEEEEVSDDDF